MAGTVTASVNVAIIFHGRQRRIKVEVVWRSICLIKQVPPVGELTMHLSISADSSDGYSGARQFLMHMPGVLFDEHVDGVDRVEQGNGKSRSRFCRCSPQPGPDRMPAAGRPAPQQQGNRSPPRDKPAYRRPAHPQAPGKLGVERSGEAARGCRCGYRPTMPHISV